MSADTIHDTYDPDLHGDDEPYDRCPFCAPIIAAIVTIAIVGGLYAIGRLLAAVVAVVL